MCQGCNQIYFKTGKFGANRLHNIAKHVVNLSFSMGGSEGYYYEAMQCNYVFPDGKPCYNKNRGSYSVECPICRGGGAMYKSPVATPVIVMDTPQNLYRDKMGAIFTDNVTVAVPSSIPLRFVELRDDGRVVVMRDKLVIKTLNADVWAVLYVDSEPKDPFLGGTLYHVVNMISHLVFKEITSNVSSGFSFTDSEAAEYFKQANQEILGINKDECSKIDNSNLIVKNGQIQIADAGKLLSDWS